VARYAAILFKKQRYVSGQHKVNLKIVCKVRVDIYIGRTR
jgi:hypothetical protein